MHVTIHFIRLITCIIVKIIIILSIYLVECTRAPRRRQIASVAINVSNTFCVRATNLLPDKKIAYL